jgi:hypothetical protein
LLEVLSMLGSALVTMLLNKQQAPLLVAV